MVNIESLSLLYFQNDEPCPYKLDCGYTIMIKPISVKNWSLFEYSLDVLTIDKNSVNDINVIRMSYLKFLKDYVFKNDETLELKQKLSTIFYYSMGEEYIYLIEEQDNKVVVVLADDKNEKVKAIITQREFDEIKKIILFQNMKNYDDRRVDTDVKELMKEYYDIKYRDTKVPSLEERKTYVIAKTGMDMKKINNMSYRTFEQVYDHALKDVLFIGRKIIQGSYKYKVDGDIEHPLYEKEKDKYEELFTSTDTLSQKGISGLEGLNNL